MEDTLRVAAVALLLQALVLAAPAAGRDLCFLDDTGGTTIYVIKKVRLPRKPYEAYPVVGMRSSGTGFSGEVLRDPGGRLGFQLTTLDPCALRVVIDDEDAMTGTATANCSGAVGESTWTAVDCNTVEQAP